MFRRAVKSVKVSMNENDDLKINFRPIRKPIFNYVQLWRCHTAVINIYSGEAQYQRNSAIWRVSIGDRSEVARLTMKNAEAFEMTSLFDEFFNFTRSSKIGQMQDIT